VEDSEKNRDEEEEMEKITFDFTFYPEPAVIQSCSEQITEERAD
jgi:hypothetical protein